MPTITPCLWFDTQALEAAEHYVSVFPDSTITDVSRYGPDMPGPLQEGDVLTVEVTLDGTPFTLLNGGPQFTFSEAVSFQISCRDQEETDHYWDRLTEAAARRASAAGSRTASASRGRSSRPVWSSSSPTPTRPGRRPPCRRCCTMRRIVIADVEAAADRAGSVTV